MKVKHEARIEIIAIKQTSVLKHKVRTDIGSIGWTLVFK